MYLYLLFIEFCWGKGDLTSLTITQSLQVVYYLPFFYMQLHDLPYFWDIKLNHVSSCSLIADGGEKRYTNPLFENHATSWNKNYICVFRVHQFTDVFQFMVNNMVHVNQRHAFFAIRFVSCSIVKRQFKSWVLTYHEYQKSPKVQLKILVFRIRIRYFFGLDLDNSGSEF